MAGLTLAFDAAVSLQWGAPILFTLAVPVLFLAGSAVWIHRERFAAQLFARAVWWSYLVFGVLWSSGPAESLPWAGSVVALGCGAALLGAGQGGITRADTAARFDPVALRGSILAAMIVGLADAQLLGLVGAASAEAGRAASKSLLLGGCVLALLAGAWGLSRLRTWAVGLNVAVSLCVLAVLAIFTDGGPLLALLGIGVLVQGVLPLRIVLARRGIDGWRVPSWVSTAVVITLMIAAVLGGVVGTFVT